MSLNRQNEITSVNPPIKWPGGKSKEFDYIKNLIPEFDRYIEPFFGGGAVYFKLRPEKAIINDFSKDLMEFYKFLKGDNDRKAFKDQLYDYVENWEKMPKYLSLFDDKFIRLYKDYKADILTLEKVKIKVSKHIEQREDEFNGLFDVQFCLDRHNLIRRIAENLVSKIRRVRELECKHGDMSPQDLERNIETAFRSGFYVHFRDVMNNFIGNDISLAKRTANFYFIREFCYGSMFRYNSSGHFNIPYGGGVYNNKDFRKKADTILSDEFRDVFKDTVIENTDFEEIFKEYNPGPHDFIFLDPPYDSDFSDYADQSFGPEDHKRLAKCLLGTKAKFLMLIKQTDFINSLYAGKESLTIASFEKRYLYNVRGRNNQTTRHLIIYNY